MYLVITVHRSAQMAQARTEAKGNAGDGCLESFRCPSVHWVLGLHLGSSQRAIPYFWQSKSVISLMCWLVLCQLHTN